MTGQPASPPHDTVPLELVTLGAAGLYVSGAGPLILAPGKPLALLTYLALTPGRRVSREFLMDLLWADLDPDRARAALRQVLFHLRRLLGEAALPGSEELTLARPMETDRDRFLRCLERGELEAAIAAYGGAFLPNFGVPGGVAFEHWADLERDRLQAAFLRSGELLVRRHLNHSRFREAQRLARRIRDEVPGAEAAWRLVLETVIAARDFVAGAVEAEALEHRANAEGVTLEPATRLAIARARRVTPVAEGSRGESTLVAELTGREREFSAIIAGWEAARTGPARHLHLVAPAGLGKTRLLRDAVARLRAGETQVVMVRGAFGERDIPFALAGELAGAIAALPGASGIAPGSAAALVALNPLLSSWLSAQADPAVGEEALRRRIQALTDLVHAVADTQPFVLVIDDLHWGDPSSLRVFEGLLGRLDRARVLCLTAARPDHLPASEGAIQVPLAPLGPIEVAALVSAIGTVPDGPDWSRDFVRGLHQATRGSPLLVLETLRLAMDHGALVLEEGEWRCLKAEWLGSLLRAGEALRQRIRGLPPAQGWLLSVLATAGTPVEVTSLDALGLDASEPAEESAAALERLGLLSRTGDTWVPVHDEIAAAARDALTPDQRLRAERVVGRWLVDSAGGDQHRLFRGVRHLAEAGEAALVERHFRRYVEVARRRHDRRSHGLLAAEVLGEGSRSERVAGLVRSLPLPWRVGLWSPARQGMAAASVVMLAVVGIVAIQAVRERDAALQRLVYSDSLGVTRVLPVRAAEWDGRNVPAVPARGRSAMAGAALAFRELVPAISPDGQSVAWVQDAGDSTTLDIWLRTPAGTRRLTSTARDDLAAGWLPDGSGLVGMTNRWSDPSVGGYDIAVFDTATGAARPVTHGEGHHGGPTVSPDGTRLAFVQQGRDGIHRLCVAAFDGQGAPECRMPGGHAIAGLLGWSGAVELVITLDSGGARPLVRYDWLRDQRSVLLGPHVYAGALSPDRRWVVGAVQLDGIRGFRDWIIPVDRPGHARLVEGAIGGPGAVRWWEGPPERAMLIDRVEFTDTTRTLLLGVETRLGIRALTAAGTEIPLHAPVRWRSSDTLVATVDSFGDVRPRGTGTVAIEASLAGWRLIRRNMVVGGSPPVTLLREDWGSGWEARWITFGEPHPVVVSGPGSIPAMWTHGDGTFASQTILRQGLDATQGLGVELRVSTPLTGGPWQSARTGLVAGIDPGAFRDADQRKAPPSRGRQESTCAVTYPGGSGEDGRRSVTVLGGIARTLDLGPDVGELGAGGWWTLRIQILPDGRCGVAINGKVAFIVPMAIPLGGEFRLRLGDESAGTRLLHGPLEVWRGVRTDIDWTPRSVTAAEPTEIR